LKYCGGHTAGKKKKETWQSEKKKNKNKIFKAKKLFMKEFSEENVLPYLRVSHWHPC
jgi:hypothetical protein